MELSAFFKEHPRVAIAFSGGVDSAYLLYAAAQSTESLCAYYVKTAFQPEFELRDATYLGQSLNAQLKILELRILEDQQIVKNSENRCYHCKHRIFSAILEAARHDGFSLLLDGTNADDREDDRPGFRAIAELGVRSPLRECGLSKAEIRRLSREAGLFTHDKPAYACLATRIATGETITEEKLRQTEQAEEYLHKLGFRNFRIRQNNGVAKLQLAKQDMPLFLQHKSDIFATLGQLYREILPEPEERS